VQFLRIADLDAERSEWRLSALGAGADEVGGTCSTGIECAKVQLL